MTAEILQAFTDEVLICEKQKIDERYRRIIETVYDFVGVVKIPDFN